MSGKHDAVAVRLSIPAKPEYISLGRLALTGLSRLRSFPEDVLADLKLALTEACTNSVRHAYDGGEGMVEILYELHSDRLVVEVTDTGEGFEHDEAEPEDSDELSEGGLGIAITLLLERSKLLVEGAGAVGVAALLSGKAKGKGSVCALLSGGNIDPTLLLSVLRHGLTVAGRYLVLRSRLGDRPGELIRFLEIVANMRANIVAIEHRREGVALEVADTEVELTVVTRNEQHCLRLIDALEAHGYPVERLR